jgi:hypothetical protein
MSYLQLRNKTKFEEKQNYDKIKKILSLFSHCKLEYEKPFISVYIILIV